MFINFPGLLLVGILILVIFLFDNEEELPLCPLRDPIETGQIKDPELVEVSGLVASHKYPGVYYSIQDSLNPSKVYAMRIDGQSIGKIL